MDNQSALITALDYFSYALAAIVIALTAAPVLPLSFWPVRIGDFPRIQIALAGTLSVALLLIFSTPLSFFDLTAAAFATVAVIYQVHAILPYTPLYPKEVEPARSRADSQTIRILISNVLVENDRTDRLLAAVDEADPDVILLAETDEKWISRIQKLKKSHPHAVERPQDNAYGMAMYSRLELVGTEVKFIVEKDVPSIHTGVRMPSGEVIRFYGVHPRPPVPSETGESTERDAELVLVGKLVREKGVPAIIAGDMNDVAWSRTTKLFQKISGMLDPRKGRGMYNSFHTEYPFLRFPLDHIFHSPHFRLVELRRLDSIGSDHFPILAVLSLENGAEKEQEQPEPETEDIKEANQKVREAERKNDTKLDGESNVNDD
ncbi:MAG: endonuclease/exonuclease/phosphatase family protein [Acidobacteriota bacterium]|nr:MAG: endonuclease/exonuclease/phosphatase family protein [Acidobacteriota bacterium]